MVIITISVPFNFWLSPFCNLDQKNPSHHTDVKGYPFTLAWCEGFFLVQIIKKRYSKFVQYMVIIKISVSFNFWLSPFCNLDQKKFPHTMLVQKDILLH